MAVTQYIGARYVPVFADPAEWTNTKQYEPLTIVLYQGNSFTSKQFVPTGIDINDTDYWALTGNYNVQVELYRQETATVKAQADATDDLIPKTAFDSTNTVKSYIDAVQAQADETDALIPKTAFDSTNTVKSYIDAVQEQADATDVLIPKTAFDSTNTVKSYIDAVSQIIPASDFDETNTVKKYIDDIIATKEIPNSPAQYYVEANYLAQIGPLPANAIIQAIAFYSDYLYFVASDNNQTVSIIGYADLLDYNVINYINIQDAPHINSLHVYNNLLYGCSANGNIYVYDPALNEITKTVNYKQLNNDGYVLHNFLICNNSLAIGMCVGSNRVLMFNHSNLNFSLCGYYDLTTARGTTPVQDSTLRSNWVYNVYSPNSGSLIKIFRQNGFEAFDLVIKNIEDEVEGIDYFGNYLYVTDSSNNIYAITNFAKPSTTSIRGLPYRVNWFAGCPFRNVSAIFTTNTITDLLYEYATINVDGTDYYIIEKLKFPHDLSQYYDYATGVQCYFNLGTALFTSNLWYNGNIRIKSICDVSGVLYYLNAEYNKVSDGYELNKITLRNMDSSTLATVTKGGNYTSFVQSMIGLGLTSAPHVFGVTSIGEAPDPINNLFAFSLRS